MIFDKEMITIVLNALIDEQGNLVSKAYEEEKAIPFNNLWSLCKSEEHRLKAKVIQDQIKRFKHLLSC